LRSFSELSSAKHLFPEVLHFDPENSIIVFKYLDNYRDLSDFYAKENHFSTSIATEMGIALATIHRLTCDRSDHRAFFQASAEPQPSDQGAASNQVAQWTQGLERIGPEVFGMFPADGLKFLALYQRFDSLGNAIAELSAAYQPCCLTHNDLKFNNILLHHDWVELTSDPQPGQSVLRFIDWERSGWGDPTFDVGSLLAGYLQIWLSSLVVSKDITIDESLRMAMIPLDLLQPSLAAFMSAYLANFPEMLQSRSNFLQRTVQFAGLALIQQIQAMIQYQKVFGNTGICMLQVAKSLLCRPEQSVSTVFGNIDLNLGSHHATAR
jgi:thiamine kinase-like enzyme